MATARYESVIARMGDGDCIMIDGATGTEVEVRGVPQIENSWNSGGVITHAEVVRQVHEDYIRAGAELVISDTFGACKHALRDAGIEEHFQKINRDAVDLAIQARDNCDRPDVLIAGGMSYWSWSGYVPSKEEIAEDAREQAKIMADAGADLIMLEMMVGVEKMCATLEAALDSGLPIWAGLSCYLDDNGEVLLLDGDTLEDAVKSLVAYDVPLINIMHTNVEDIFPCLEVVQPHWDRLVGVYAHTGKFDSRDESWIEGTAISPEGYAEYANQWIGRGINLIGGCCGVGVGHIQCLAGQL